MELFCEHTPCVRQASDQLSSEQAFGVIFFSLLMSITRQSHASAESCVQNWQLMTPFNA